MSCIAELAPELTTIVRLHHQFKWFHSGMPLLGSAAAAPYATLLHQDCHQSFVAICCLPERPRNTTLKITCLVISHCNHKRKQPSP